MFMWVNGQWCVGVCFAFGTKKYYVSCYDAITLLLLSFIYAVQITVTHINVGAPKR